MSLSQWGKILWPGKKLLGGCKLVAGVGDGGLFDTPAIARNAEVLRQHKAELRAPHVPPPVLVIRVRGHPWVGGRFMDEGAHVGG